MSDAPTLPPDADKRLVVIDGQLVTMLEQLLDDARAGRISGAALLVMGIEDGETGRIDSVHTAIGGSVHRNVHMALGGVRVLETWMLNRLLQWGETTAGTAAPAGEGGE